MHQSYIVFYKISIIFIRCISFAIPSNSSIVMLLSSYSRSAVIRFPRKLSHYIVERSIVFISISIKLLPY
nr:MAG TPA: hypothetical protein [Crassvirales sp.]